MTKGKAATDGYADLVELALDLRWSWSDSSDNLWRQLDAELWDLTQNPWVVLQTVSKNRVNSLLSEPGFRGPLEVLQAQRKHDAKAPTWFSQHYPQSKLTCVAYFSMEFMLSEALPIYSGGLGNVAGDQLKGASDLGVPVVGVGLLYQRGYFRQVIGQEGTQEALYPYNDPGQLPVTPLRQPNGEWLRLEIALPGYSVWLRAWQVQVGRVKLYLLDSNDAANFPAHRGITSELYGGGPELRLKQEMLLGIGGWRLLEALGLEPEVCHLNEGHAALAVLERARGFMNSHQVPFETAMTATRAGNLFTTHTAVAAGFDQFSPALMAQYLGNYAQSKLGLSLKELLALGRRDPQDENESFNMAYLAIRGSGSVNGVSRLHGQVSRSLFAPLFPEWPEAEVPISSVTNGVHMASWDSEVAHQLWTKACGKDRWLGTMDNVTRDIRQVSDADLWSFRGTARSDLVTYARERLARQLAGYGASAEAVDQAHHLFDPGVLTLGFARRFATYKRPNLLLTDPERLIRLLTDPQRPVQLILAGKAHPADLEGQALIQQWSQFIHRPEVRPHVMFLSDYDMQLGAQLVQGVDVWLNTPRRPWEACGTSGMKILVNGGLNLSVLDGWWAEAFDPDVGWTVGDGLEHDASWDAADASALYQKLENEVIPSFYQRDDHGIPSAWVFRIRESMARLTPQFSANRCVREYTEKHYLPAAAAFGERAADHGALAIRIVQSQRDLAQRWNGLRFLSRTATKTGDQHHIEVELDLSGLDPALVRVELYGEAMAKGESLRQEMKPGGTVTAAGGSRYVVDLRSDRPATDFTARAVAHFDAGSIPLEDRHIRWQR